MSLAFHLRHVDETGIAAKFERNDGTLTPPPLVVDATVLGRSTCSRAGARSQRSARGSGGGFRPNLQQHQKGLGFTPPPPRPPPDAASQLLQMSRAGRAPHGVSSSAPLLSQQQQQIVLSQQAQVVQPRPTSRGGTPFGSRTVPGVATTARAAELRMRLHSGSRPVTDPRRSPVQGPQSGGQQALSGRSTPALGGRSIPAAAGTTDRPLPQEGTDSCSGGYKYPLTPAAFATHWDGRRMVSTVGGTQIDTTSDMRAAPRRVYTTDAARREERELRELRQTTACDGRTRMAVNRDSARSNVPEHAGGVIPYSMPKRQHAPLAGKHPLKMERRRGEGPPSEHEVFKQSPKPALRPFAIAGSKSVPSLLPARAARKHSSDTGFTTGMPQAPAAAREDGGSDFRTVAPWAPSAQALSLDSRDDSPDLLRAAAAAGACS
jgi:hypothetical protein